MGQTSVNEIVEIALFPIPGCVCFPNTTVPVHVFEPRYRSLMKDSVRLNRLVGICHTQKIISPAKPEQSTAQILNSNQATYEPHKIFSAGLAEITELTADGRLGVQVSMTQRFQWVEDIQLLPYRIVKCRQFHDTTSNDPETSLLRAEIEVFFKRLLDDTKSETDSVTDNVFENPTWRELTDSEFSFKIFSAIKFDGDLCQMILEMQSPNDRLKALLQILKPQAPNLQ